MIESVPNGLGLYIYGNGSRYQGNFFDGLFTGPGTYFFPSGDIYNVKTN
jgi:hypothetical protein